MNFTLLCCAVIAMQEPAPDPRQAETDQAEEVWQDEDDRQPFDGFKIESEDGSYRLAITGKLQNDWAFFSADPDVEAATSPFEDGTEFRRARLGLKGDMFEYLRFKVNLEFADDQAGFRDLYAEIRKIPLVGAVRIGQFKEPFSLENRTGSSNLTFLERSLADAFAPGRNVGVMAYNDILDKHATYAIGAFRETDDKAFGVDSEAGQELGLTTRVTIAPWYEDKGRQALHFGGSLSFRNPDDGEVRFRERPESHLAPRIVDTGRFPAENVLATAFDTAIVLGPASLQAQVSHAKVDRGPVPSPGFSAYYVQGSYFVTGEHRPYKRSNGNFGTVEPRSDVFNGGHGAWEVAARYSQVDLTDSGVVGGEARNLGAALNWYLNTNARFQLNYIITDLESVGNATIIQFRFHLDW